MFAAVAAAALLVYGSSLGNEFVIWDDDSLVYRNPLTQSFTLKNIWGAFTSYDPELYVPLTIFSFQVEHAIIGFNPFFYHFNNLLLHIGVSWLVLAVLRRLGLRRETAFLCAMLFAVHPLNTEAVAWVSARKDLLATLFSLLALVKYLDWRRHGDTRDVWMTFAWMLCAVLSKPVAVVLPAVFLLLDWKDGRPVRIRMVRELWPFAGLSVLFLIVGILGKTRNISALSAVETALLAAKSTVFSLQKFIWPTNLSPIYLQTDPISAGLPQFWIPLLVLLALALVTAWTLRRSRVMAFGLLLYMLFLLPSFSNFAKDQSIYFFSDRYVYLSQIGLLFVLAAVAERLPMRKLVAGLTVPLLLILGWKANAQSGLWSDSETLYRDALRVNPTSVVLHYNLAHLEHARGNLEAARAEYEKTLELNPRYAKTFTNLGMMELERGDRSAARELFIKAMEADPHLAEPHNNLGSILYDEGDIEGAIREFREAIRLSETYAQAHINLGSAYGRQGKYDQGLAEYKKAFAIDPRLRTLYPDAARALDALR